jgi:hypothetical protein
MRVVDAPLLWMGRVVRRVWLRVPCRYVGHGRPWVYVNKGRVGLCGRCGGFFRVGKDGRAEGRELREVDGRSVRRAVGRGMGRFEPGKAG